MKTIILTSSGFLRKPIRDEIVGILPKLRPLRVSYISTASKVVRDDSYAEKDVKIMNELGFLVDEIDLAKIERSSLERKLRANDFIYVQGGNPYWLLKQVRISGFDVVVPKLIEDGIPYIGKSAGAYILGPEVSTPQVLGKEWNRYDVQDIKGLGIVPFVLAAHFTEDVRQDLEVGMKLSHYPLRLITNDQAILIMGDETRMIGKGEEIKLSKEGGSNFDNSEIKE